MDTNEKKEPQYDNSEEQTQSGDTHDQSEGDYMSLGLCLGLCLGGSLGQLLFDNIATGISIGMCLGLAIGMSIKKKN